MHQLGQGREQLKLAAQVATVLDLQRDSELYVKNNNKPSEYATKKSMMDHHIKPLLGKVSLDQVGPKIEWFKAQLRERASAGGQGVGHGKKKRKRKLGLKRINNILGVVSRMLR